MRNKLYKAIIVNCANPIFLNELSLKRKSANEVSDFSLQRSMNGGSEMKGVRYLQTVVQPRLVYSLIHISHRRSNVVGLKCLSLRSAHFFAEDSLLQENRDWRNSHFKVHGTDFSYRVLYLFCELRLFSWQIFFY